ncbi:hypothetical protein LSH36_162g01004 [Paralvinella palmiformis]|uniref:Cytoplasmic dynein 2 light intermediate chain 1 n=1 Tax=Paralvinella palmiformis TaxID=53620 RepID=A0AAD9N6R4_9ANNE|nr:hypothetical protein LSH36_162g01004 [Paralvinella palmiformis]
MAKGEKSLWDLALLQANSAEEEELKGEESTVVFFGSKNAGKTSIILRFLDREETPKPTTGLEYTFGRRAKGANLAKDVGHIWELGGGTWLSRLIDVPLNPNTIKHTAMILVLDLSKPSELWFTLEKFLTIIRSRVDAVINETRMQQPDIKEQLKRQTWQRIGEEHVDKDLIDPLLIPLVIVGTKYDIFQEFDPEKRKVICKTLRFVAHTYGAHLQNISDPSLVEDPAKDAQYIEAVIDTMRRQKDEELERYRRSSERRAREAQRGHAEMMIK